MSDLLDVSVRDFLIMTQSFTLPYLVLLGKVDVIERIKQASRPEEDYVICLDPQNLLPILGLLMIQSVPDHEKYILKLLTATSSRFKEFDIIDLMRTEPATLITHLLKAAGDADDQKKGRVSFFSERYTT